MRKIQLVMLIAWAILLALTVRAFSEMNLLQAATSFYTDLRYGWRAQLNFDFQIYLILAALWIFYRERSFSRSCIFALFELLAGNLFLVPYLIYIISGSKGDIKKILLGRHFIN